MVDLVEVVTRDGSGTFDRGTSLKNLKKGEIILCVDYDAANGTNRTPLLMVYGGQHTDCFFPEDMFVPGQVDFGRIIMLSDEAVLLGQASYEGEAGRGVPLYLKASSHDFPISEIVQFLANKSIPKSYVAEREAWGKGNNPIFYVADEIHLGKEKVLERLATLLTAERELLAVLPAPSR